MANVVRDTSDAGALEYWGVGAFNTAHHNCFSDMDPGLLEGGWLNFLFQDDAAHYLNHSSNILMEVKAAGSQEAGMMKSIGSVFENNIVVDSTVGHIYQLTPYLLRPIKIYANASEIQTGWSPHSERSFER